MGCGSSHTQRSAVTDASELIRRGHGPSVSSAGKDNLLIACIYETPETGMVFLSGDTSADLLQDLYRTLANGNRGVVQRDAEQFSPGCRWNIVFTGTRLCYGGPTLFPNGKKFNRILDNFVQAGWIPQASMQINGIGDDAGCPQQNNLSFTSFCGGRPQRKTQSILVFERRAQANEKIVADGEANPTEGSLVLAVKDNGKGKICAAGPQNIISILKTTFVERLKKYCPGICCDFDMEDTDEAWDCVWQGVPVTWLMDYEPHLDDEAKALNPSHPMKGTRFPIGKVFMAIIEELYNLNWKLVTSPSIGGWTCLVFTPNESLKQKPVCVTAIQEFRGLSKVCIAGSRSDAVAHRIVESLQSSYDPEKACHGRPWLQKDEDDDWVQVVRNAPLTTFIEGTYVVQCDTFTQLLKCMTHLGWKPVACPTFSGIGKTSWPTIVWEYDVTQRGLNVACMAFSSACMYKLGLHGDLIVQEIREELSTQAIGTKGRQKESFLRAFDMVLPSALTSKTRNVPFGHNLRMLCGLLFKQGLHAAGALNFLQDAGSCSGVIFVGGLSGQDSYDQSDMSDAAKSLHFFEGDWKDIEEKAIYSFVSGRDGNLLRVFATSTSTVVEITQDKGHSWYAGQELHANGLPIRRLRIRRSEDDTLVRQIHQGSSWSTPSTLVRMKTADYEAQGTYNSMDTIWQALEKRNTVLIKGSWLINWYKSGATLPRRQDLPDGAAWDNAALRQMAEKRDVFMVAISYAWSAPEHPDASGKQMETLAKILEMRLEVEYKNGYRVHLDAAVFLDWASLYQEERTLDEKNKFHMSLLQCNLWYAHEATEAWLVTQVQPGVRPYPERGWPSFEKAVASMVTPDHMLLDVGKFDPQTMTNWTKFYTSCKAGRDSPKSPEEFNAELAEKHFTNGADLSMVQNKYSSTFTRIMSSTFDLSFSNLRWKDNEAMTLANALFSCVHLEKIDLKANNIGKDGVEAIIKAAKDCPRLEVISLTKNPLGGTGLSAIAPHLPHVKTLKTIWFNECDITDEGVVHMCTILHLCTTILNIYLFDNKITNVGCEAFCDVFPKCSFLVQFGIGGNKFDSPMEERMKKAWKIGERAEKSKLYLR